jgi:signal transduction histidine kinase
MTGWFARLSLRWRLMAIGLAGVAGALLLGGLLLYATMTAALVRAVDDDARVTAHDVAVLVDADRLPEPVPVPGSQIVQVLDAGNRVMAGSATADRLTPLVTTSEREALLRGAAMTVPGSRAARSGDLRVVAVAAGTPAAPVAVVAAAPTADLETSRQVLRIVLVVLFPLVLLALGLVAWRVIGSALRPVEELRHGAERIGGGMADEHLPVPPTQDEISALATTLNRMLDRLATARAQQRTFVADAAHELRSPLATVRTQLEVAARLGEGGALPAELLPEVERLSGLVEDLLVLARAGDDTRVVAEEVDLEELLGDVGRRYAGARVPVRLAPSVGSRPVVRASRSDLLRAVTNLVDNAVRHASSRVDLAASTVPARPPAVEVSVRDDGHGIPEEERERVFDRFARLDEARDRDSGGTGLGLPIARALVERNAGQVWLEDAGPGVRAVITLPGSDGHEPG